MSRFGFFCPQRAQFSKLACPLRQNKIPKSVAVANFIRETLTYKITDFCFSILASVLEPEACYCLKCVSVRAGVKQAAEDVVFHWRVEAPS